MKYLGIIGGLLLAVFAGIYALLFTSPGNAVIAPIVEKKINEAVGLSSTLEKFELRSDSFAVTLLLDDANSIEAVGNFSLFSQTLDAAYRVRLDKLESLKKLTQTPLYGKLHTDGTVVGSLNELVIDGKSDVAHSVTTYNVLLTDFSPSRIKAEIGDADVKTLLAMGGQKPFADAKFSLDANLKSIDPAAMDGNIVLAVTDGKINQSIMKEDFNITLPKTDFELNTNARLDGKMIEYTMLLNSNLAHVDSKGTLSPEPLQTDIAYAVDFKELALLRPLTNSPLRGPFSTQGTIKGDEKAMKIKGSSTIAKSDTRYDIALKAMQPEQVLLTMAHAKIDKLLYLAGEPAYASGDLNIDIKLENLDPENLQGNADITLSKGLFNSKILKKSYDVNLPKTRFNASMNAKLNGKDITYKTLFDSTLAKISSGGTIVPKTLGMDLDYALSIEKLELLKPLTNAPLQGPLALNGTVKGDKAKLIVNGYTDIAKSKTDFTATLEEFAPRSVKAQMKQLKLAPLFTMLSQPHYADGTVDLNIDIPDARVGHLNGTVSTSLSKGRLDGKQIGKDMNLTGVPNAPFSVKTYTTLDKNIIDTQTDVDSSLITLNSKHATMDLENNLITADYRVNIPDLSKLYFITERPLKGAIALFGDLKKDEHLLFTAHSDTLGGSLDAKLLDDNFHADLKNIQTLEALEMLVYPEIFKSSLNGTLDYNLASKKGLLDSTLSDGLFARNIMMDLYKQYGKRNLYKERFDGTLKSRILDSKTDTDLDLHSKKSSISTEHMLLDTKTKQVNAKIHIVANNNPLDIYLKGSLDEPDVKIDAEKIIEKEAGKQLNKLFKKLF